MIGMVGSNIRLTAQVGVILCLVLAPVAAQADAALWKKQGWIRTDFSRAAVDLTEILSGGPPKDGIPSIDRPLFAPIADIEDLGDNEPVIAVALDGDARAYPLRILIWHEIVNDTVGGRPVAVTYCPLCNSAIVFDRRAGDRMLDFGTTGKLRNSDLVMYDRETESWWQQFTGEAIVGELTGTKLATIPARLESFALFRERHPEGKVLIPNNPEARSYGRNPYGGYDSRAAPYQLFRGELPDYIDPMARVVAFKSGGQPRAVALSLLAERKTIDEGDVTLAWTQGQSSALDTTDISKGRDVGNVTVRQGPDDSRRDVAYDITFAFVFHAFHPEQRIRQD